MVQKYNEFLLNKLEVKQADTDMSFQYHNDPELNGLLGVYVDDTLAAGNDDFKNRTDAISENFESRPEEYPPILFAGMMINKTENGFFLEQHKYISDINILP